MKKPIYLLLLVFGVAFVILAVSLFFRWPLWPLTPGEGWLPKDADTWSFRLTIFQSISAVIGFPVLLWQIVTAKRRFFTQEELDKKIACLIRIIIEFDFHRKAMPEGTDKVHVKYLPEKAEMDTGVNNQITITYNSRPYIFEVKTITTTGKGWGGGITSEARKTLEEKVNARLKNDDNGNLPQL